MFQNSIIVHYDLLPIKKKTTKSDFIQITKVIDNKLSR